MDIQYVKYVDDEDGDEGHQLMSYLEKGPYVVETVNTIIAWLFGNFMS